MLSLKKTLQLEMSWSSRRPMKEFPQKKWSRINPLIQKIMLMVRLTVILVGGGWNI